MDWLYIVVTADLIFLAYFIWSLHRAETELIRLEQAFKELSENYVSLYTVQKEAADVIRDFGATDDKELMSLVYQAMSDLMRRLGGAL